MFECLFTLEITFNDMPFACIFCEIYMQIRYDGAIKFSVVFCFFVCVVFVLYWWSTNNKNRFSHSISSLFSAGNRLKWWFCERVNLNPFKKWVFVTFAWSIEHLLHDIIHLYINMLVMLREQKLLRCNWGAQFDLWMAINEDEVNTRTGNKLSLKCEN